MEANAAVAQPRRGRPCGVCALSSEHRTMLESALAAGTSIVRISRQDWAPGRESIAYHLRSGHLPEQLQQRAERALGLDHTSVVARISDIAQRARTTALEAAEAEDRIGVLRAGDSELRALSVLAAAGETSEHEVAQHAAHRDLSAAVIRLARRYPEAAEAVAAELDRMYLPLLSAEIRDQFPDARNEITT